MTDLLLRTSLQSDTHQNANENRISSRTVKIDQLNPIDFYQFNHAGFKGKRFFWKSSDDQLYLIGLGIAASITSSHPKYRFDDIDKQWRALMANADIVNPYEVPGTGPLLFGGFSFDPNSIKEREWEEFGDAIFYLPTYMLSMTNQEWYLTINFLGDSLSEEFITKKLNTFITELSQTKQNDPLEPLKIIESNEVQQEKWIQSVEQIVQALNHSEMKKVVLARKMNLLFNNDVSSTYVLQQLLNQQSTSYVFGLEVGKSSFIGASPERLIKKIENDIFSTCLAGSIARGMDEADDEALGVELLNDSKNLFEHELVVAMIEDALRPFCTELLIPSSPALLKTPNIQHLYTPVKGKVKKNQSIIKMVERMHPTPALGGVPTNAALEMIRDKEDMDRGFYASPIGWIDYRGNGEFIVGIRSGLFKEREGYLYAGCGLVSGSVSQQELIETRIKFQPMLTAVEGEKK